MTPSVVCLGDTIVIDGRVRVVASRGVLHLVYAELHAAGISVDEALYDVVWAACQPGVIDAVEVAWREGDPNETYVVRQR